MVFRCPNYLVDFPPRPDIAGVDPNLMGPRLDRIDRQEVIKVDICNDGDRGCFTKVSKDFVIILRRVTKSNNIAAHCVELADPPEQCLGSPPINRQGIIIHRLNENWLSSPDHLISYMYKMKVVHRFLLLGLSVLKVLSFEQ